MLGALVTLPPHAAAPAAPTNRARHQARSGSRGVVLPMDSWLFMIFTRVSLAFAFAHALSHIARYFQELRRQPRLAVVFFHARAQLAATLAKAGQQVQHLAFVRVAGPDVEAVGAAADRARVGAAAFQELQPLT